MGCVQSGNITVWSVGITPDELEYLAQVYGYEGDLPNLDRLYGAVSVVNNHGVSSTEMLIMAEYTSEQARGPEYKYYVWGGSVREDDGTVTRAFTKVIHMDALDAYLVEKRGLPGWVGHAIRMLLEENEVQPCDSV